MVGIQVMGLKDKLNIPIGKILYVYVKYVTPDHVRPLLQHELYMCPLKALLTDGPEFGPKTSSEA